MRPAIIAFALALSLFILVQHFRPPVLYLALLLPLGIFLYGFAAKEYAEENNGDNRERGPYDGENIDDLDGEPGGSGN